MKALPVLGVLLLILGALAFVIPLPHRDDHSVSVGDAKFTLQTESREAAARRRHRPNWRRSPFPGSRCAQEVV